MRVGARASVRVGVRAACEYLEGDKEDLDEIWRHVLIVGCAVVARLKHQRRPRVAREALHVDKEGVEEVVKVAVVGDVKAARQKREELHGEHRIDEPGSQGLETPGLVRLVRRREESRAKPQ